jgi:Zn-dependent M16 (insulinase) family peptidase
VLAAFLNALDLAVAGSGITDEVLEKAVIRTVGQLDLPQPPQDRGLELWLGHSVEMLRERRARIFKVTKEQIVQVAQELRAIAPVVLVCLGKDKHLI